MTDQRYRPMVIRGMEVVNSDDLDPGTMYYLVQSGERTTRKRGGNESKKILLVRGVKSTTKDPVCRVRVYRDRSARKRLQLITEVDYV